MIDVRALFAFEREALLGLLRSLSPSDWRLPTVCPGWDVGDVAAHLLGDDLGRLARTRDGHGGPAPYAGEDVPSFLDRSNDEWVVAARRMSPRLLIDLLEGTGRQIDLLWRSADLTDIGEPVSWAGPGAAPVWLDAARDYTEYWVHQQQIRDAVGRAALTEPALLHPVLDVFMRALPWTLREAPAWDGARVTFEVTGPAGGTWRVIHTEQGWVFEDTAVGTSDAHITLDQDTTWRLCTRGCEPDDARSRATLAGHDGLAQHALRIVSIVHPDRGAAGRM